MKTIIALFLAAGALAVCMHDASAQDTTPTTSKVLLLTSERLLEGDIERVGDRYRIRRGTSEVWIPAGKALLACADLQEAYKVMKGRANLADPDERLRLSRWCLLNHLLEQALAEAHYALEMRPDHSESKAMVANLERTQASKTSAPAPTAVPDTRPIPVKPAAPVDINADSLQLFTQKVQPILLNACASCHSGGRGGEFQLSRSYEGGQRGATQRNLGAVLAQLHMEKPALSPLLIKAVSAHGESASAPIKSQQALPFRTLIDWIDRTLTTNPHLRERWRETAKNQPEPMAPTVFAKSTANPSTAIVSRPLQRAQDVESKSNGLNSPSKQVDAEAASKSTVSSATAPLDLFDPAIFNREMHPRK